MFKNHSEQQEVENTAYQEDIEKSVRHSCNFSVFRAGSPHNRASYLAISFAGKNPVL